MAERPVRLLLVDDHQVVRLGLRALFATVPHVSVVGEAGTLAEALVEARRSRPDVIVLDVRLPDGSGVEACREIRSEYPETRVLMLTSYGDEEAVVASIMAGASGYILKQTDPERLVEAVEVAARGGALLDPAVTRTILEWMRRADRHSSDDPLGSLSEPEDRILRLIAEGMTNREIAATLYFSEHTIKSYVSSILQKLHLSRRAEAAAYIARRRPGIFPNPSGEG